MKAKEKYQGAEFQHSNDKKRRNNSYMIQYEGAIDMSFRDIRVSKDNDDFSRADQLFRNWFHKKHLLALLKNFLNQALVFLN